MHLYIGLAIFQPDGGVVPAKQFARRTSPLLSKPSCCTHPQFSYRCILFSECWRTYAEGQPPERRSYSRFEIRSSSITQSPFVALEAHFDYEFPTQECISRVVLPLSCELSRPRMRSVPTFCFAQPALGDMASIGRPGRAPRSENI